MNIIHILQRNDFLSPNFNSGGRAKLVFDLATTQAQLGHSVSIIAVNKSDIVGCKVYSNGSRHTSKFPFPFNILDKRIREIRNIISSLKMIDNTYDIIHNHIEWEGALFSRFAPIPILTTIHGWLTEKLRGLIYSKLCDIPSISKYTTVSKSGFYALKPLFKTKLINYVHPGVDTEVYSFKKKTPSKILRLCCIGRITKVKGHHKAIEIADRLMEKKIPVMLVIAGANLGGSSSYLQKIINEINKRDYVKLMMNISNKEIVDIYQQSDATLMPVEWNELFGLVAIESMACGTPVIASNRGALLEVIEHGKTGFLARNVKEFIHACQNIKDISPEYCRKYVDKKFSLKASAARYIEIYKSLKVDKESA